MLEALRGIAPVTFVRGNNDHSDSNEIMRITISGLRVLLTHILPRPSAGRCPLTSSSSASISIIEGDRAMHIALDERSIEALQKASLA